MPSTQQRDPLTRDSKAELPVAFSLLDVVTRHAERVSETRERALLAELLMASTLALAPEHHVAVFLYEPTGNRFRLEATSDSTRTIGTPYLHIGAEGEIRVEFPFYGLQKAIAASAYHVPLISQNQIVGLLLVYARSTTQSAPLSSATLQGFQLLAASSASAIALASHRTGVEYAQPLVRAMQALSFQLTRTVSPAQLAKQSLHLVASVVPFAHGTLWQKISNSQILCLAVLPESAHTSLSREPVSLDDMPLARELVSHRKTICLDELAQSTVVDAWLVEKNARSWIGVPLVSAKGVVGLLVLDSPAPNFFTQAQQRNLEVLAAPLALWLRSLALQQQTDVSRARLAKLLQQMMRSQEEERKRVSRELHDEAGQSLTSLTLNLEMLQQEVSGQSRALVERVRESVNMTRQALERMRLVSRTLRPPALDMLGLSGALEQLCIDVARRSGIKIEFAAKPFGELDDEISLTLYRFAQEGLTNIVRHANATQAYVSAECTEAEICVSVRDNGKGFNVSTEWHGKGSTGRMGLVGMQERLMLVNGVLEIESKPGSGTELCARVPLNHHQARPQK